MTSNPSPSSPVPGASFLAAYLGHLGMPEDEIEVLDLAAYLECEAWKLQEKVDELMAAVDLLRSGLGIDPTSPLRDILEKDVPLAIPCHISKKGVHGASESGLLNDGPDLGYTLRGALTIEQVRKCALRFSLLDLMENLSTTFDLEPISWAEGVRIAKFFNCCAKQMYQIGAAAEGLALCHFCEEDLARCGNGFQDDPINDSRLDHSCEACRCAIRDAISHERGMATLWTGEQIIVPEPPLT